MILSCNNISKSFGDVTLFTNVGFTVDDREKVALVGNNGAGKTTLLKILLGESSPDDGNIFRSKDATIGYLSQHTLMDSELSVYEEVLSTKKSLIQDEEKLHSMEKKMSELSGDALEELLNDYNELNNTFIENGGLTYKKEINSVLTGLGFTDEDNRRPINTLSGGQKTRLSLALILLNAPSLLILDEPTNHLDISSVQWLEEYLKSYNKAVLIVSHDRYFLDKIATKVIGIENKKAVIFNGNYSDYAKKSKERYEAMLKAYKKNRDEIKHQTEVIEKLKQFNREKSIKRAESRQKMLDKTERLEKPVLETTDMNILLDYDVESGKDVLDFNAVSKSFEKNLFDNVTFSIKKGEHVALIGDNGVGKSTLLKLIMHEKLPDKGSITLGENVTLAYYDQDQLSIKSDKTLFDEISDAYPDMNNTSIRNMLAAFSFTGDDVFKSCNSLSGGEKGRLSLAKLMLCRANFIILDEPTNHLDNYSKEILENALNDYKGTLLFVSHDRYFINSCANKVLCLDSNGITAYLGNYDYYLEKKTDSVEIKAENVSQGKIDYKLQREEQNRLNKLKNRLKTVEEEISKLEAHIKEQEELMNTDEISRNQSKLLRIHEDIEASNDKLDELMLEWEELDSKINS